MKYDQEIRIQIGMIVAAIIGLIGVLGLVLMALIQTHLSYLFNAGTLLVIVFIIIGLGQRWTQKTMDRVRKIRDGAGNEADIEWLKTRKKQ